MNTFNKILFSFVFASFSIGVSAQSTMPNNPPQQGNPRFTQQELDQMLAPIALYPDPLLSQVLMASTYPLEIVQAARWSSAHPGLKGDQAVQALGNPNWDASVKSLVAFPQVLQTLDQKIDWTERMGDAFLAQQSEVMDTIQGLRQRARTAGNLNSNAQVNVAQDDGEIAIDDANPQVAYVPYYDPSVAYGAWAWPDYPPVFWSPWAGYGWNSGFAWGLGIGIGVDFFFGGWDWHHHGVFARGGRFGGGLHAWQHDPAHRGGVPYRSAALNRQFGRARSAATGHSEFRGYANQSAQRGTEHGNVSHAGLGLQTQRNVPERSGAIRNTYRTSYDMRSHAFDSVGHGAAARSYSARGNVSMSHGASHSAPSHASSGASHGSSSGSHH